MSKTRMILTVAARPIFTRASSISGDGFMCWSVFRNILRLPLNAELTYEDHVTCFDSDFQETINNI